MQINAPMNKTRPLKRGEFDVNRRIVKFGEEETIILAQSIALLLLGVVSSAQFLLCGQYDFGFEQPADDFPHP